ncbi:MAG: acetyltransferase [Acidobacteriota bacterium]
MSKLQRIVIIGAGGHGREVADILRHQSQIQGQIDIVGFIDDNPALRGQLLDGVPVLGDWTWFEGVGRRDFAVITAVGNPLINQQLVERAHQLELKFVSAISPLAHLSSFARLGEGVTIFPHAVVNTNAFIASHVILNIGVSVSHDTQVGRYTNINPGAHLAGNVTVGEGCYIGMGANIIQGRTIGDWSIVGAGATVIADLPERVTAVGVPARIIKTREIES